MKKSRKSLDKVDKNILKVLQEDGRIANVELAERVHLSPSPCLARVKRLEDEGYIRGYRAELEPALLGFGTVAFIQVSLQRTTEDVFSEFKREVSRDPIVSECFMVAGGYDYLLKVRFADADQYRAVLERVVRFPGVAQTHTYMVIEEVKSDDRVPITLDRHT